MIIIGIIVAVIMFSVIVLVHELGHFSAARKFGVKVEEFGLGIPPKAKKLFTDKKGTIFTLNWLPLGGFVRLKGEDPHSLQDKNDPEALSNKHYLAQSIIILGGVFMNFLLAIIIFSVLFFIGVKPIGINDKINTNLDLKIIPTYDQAIKSGLLNKGEGIILYPIEGSIAEDSGIQEGDKLIEINGKKIDTPEDAMNSIGNSMNTEISLSIIRKTNCVEPDECLSSIPYTLTITPNSEGKIGSYLSPNITLNENFEYKYGFFESIKYGTLETYNQSLLTFKALGILIKKIISPETPTERTEAVENMRGPIGIVDLVANSLEAGIIFIILIGAIISINLGVFNLLPIPALDGGRFLLISINSFFSKISGKKAITQNTENFIHVSFFIILIALSIIIGYNDITHIINR